MCQRVKCRQCGKPTYAGCGMHIEAVLHDVPPSDRCQCKKGEDVPTPSTQSAWTRWFGR